MSRAAVGRRARQPTPQEHWGQPMSRAASIQRQATIQCPLVQGPPGNPPGPASGREHGGREPAKDSTGQHGAGGRAERPERDGPGARQARARTGARGRQGGL